MKKMTNAELRRHERTYNETLEFIEDAALVKMGDGADAAMIMSACARVLVRTSRLMRPKDPAASTQLITEIINIHLEDPSNSTPS